MRRTRNRNKWKKLLLPIGAIIIIIIVIAIIVINVNKEKTPNVPDDGQEVYQLQDTTYNGLEITNVMMEYLPNNNETMITFQINNVSTQKVEQEQVQTLLVNGNGEIIGKILTLISSLDVGKQQNSSVVLKGDLTSTTQMKIEKMN